MDRNSEIYLPINLPLRRIGISFIKVMPRPFIIGFLDNLQILDIYINDFSSSEELYQRVQERLLNRDFHEESIEIILSYLNDHQREIEDMIQKSGEDGK